MAVSIAYQSVIKFRLDYKVIEIEFTYLVSCGRKMMSDLFVDFVDMLTFVLLWIHRGHPLKRLAKVVSNMQYPYNVGQTRKFVIVGGFGCFLMRHYAVALRDNLLFRIIMSY
jgi:hypothetical protein